MDDQSEAWIPFMGAPDELVGPVNLGTPEEITILDLAREKPGWEPRVPLREGLTRTIEYFESAL